MSSCETCPYFDYCLERATTSNDLSLLPDMRDVVIVSLTASDEEHIRAEKEFLLMPNRMNVAFTWPRSKLIVVGSKKMFRVIPADRDEQYEELVDGRTVLRSKNVTMTNHFKRWYFHVKGSQRIVEAKELATTLL
jgi:hypothetical protein